MATRFGYDKAIGLTGPLSVDWSQVTGETVKYLNELQQKKDTTRKELATEGRELAEQLAKNPYDYTSKYYGFWGKSSNQVMNLMTTLNDNFKNGDISKTDRDIKSANLQGQVEQYIAASQKFAQQEKERAKNAGPEGIYGAEDIFENEILASALNYENIEPLFDPDGYTFNVLVTGKDGVKRIMSGNEVFATEERPTIGKFDMNKNVKEAFERIGVKTITKADGSVVAGDFVTKQGEEADNALRNLAQTMIQQPVQLRSMLSTYPISIEEDGEIKNYTFSRELLPLKVYDMGTGDIKKDELKKLLDNNPTIFYRDIQGNYYQSDKAKEIGEKYAMEQLTLAAQYTEKEAKAEDELTEQDIQSNLIKKIQTVALYGDKVPRTLIEQLLTEEELAEYDNLVESQGGTDAIQGLVDDITTVVGLSDLTEEQFADNDTVNQALGSLQALGIDASVSGGGNVFSARIINIKERGDKGQGISINTKGKTQQQIIDEIVRLVPSVRSLEDLATSLAFIRRQSNPQGDT